MRQRSLRIRTLIDQICPECKQPVPAVHQGEVNGIEISWNPDDGRFYLRRNDEFLASFTLKRNAVVWARSFRSEGEVT